LVSAEVGLRWVELESVKIIEGKSTLNAENIDTLMRSQEKALEMAKVFLGKTISPENLRRGAIMVLPPPPLHRRVGDHDGTSLWGR
jgi:hypothetical protein